jgi:hypothetical protein
MSSIKQEVAAILMNYTNNMSEDTYMSILNELAAIPDHRDPKKARELLKELDETKEQLVEQTEENDMLIEQLDEADRYINATNQLLDAVMGGGPVYEDDELILYNKVSLTIPPEQRVQELIQGLHDGEESIYTPYIGTIDWNIDSEQSELEGTGDCHTRTALCWKCAKGPDRIGGDNCRCGWPIEDLLDCLKLYGYSANNYFGYILLHETNGFYNKLVHTAPFWRFRYGKIEARFEIYKHQRKLINEQPSRTIPLNFIRL